MKLLDKLLQRWRIKKAAAYIPEGAAVLDIGSSDGALFQQLGKKISHGTGIDPDLEADRSGENFRLIKGFFPQALGQQRTFDVITMLAVLEHIPPAEQKLLAEHCASCLKPGGLLLITVPSHMVDRILAFLRFLRLIDGMSLEQHYGFRPSDTIAVFSPYLRLEKRKYFQLGLNNLFVFRK